MLRRHRNNVVLILMHVREAHSLFCANSGMLHNFSKKGQYDLRNLSFDFYHQ